MTTTGEPTAVRRLACGAFGGLPRAFWFQWVGTLVNRLGTFVEPFLVLYLTSARGLSPGQAGVVLAGYGAGALVAPVLGGALADRVGRRATLVGGMLAAAAALLALSAARDPLHIAVAAGAVGLAGDLYRPASAALVADLVDPADRPRAYGLLFWAINLGFSVAAVAGGWLAERGYGLLFVADAATCAGFALLIALGVRGDTRPVRVVGEPRVGYGTALRDPLLVALVVLTFGYATLYVQAYVTLPLAVVDAGLSPARYGLVLAVNGVLIVVLQPFAAMWLARFDRIRVLAVATAVVGLGFATTGLAASVPAFAASVALWTLGEIGTAGSAQALVADLAPADARGRYSGLFGLGFGASAVAGPLVGATVYDALGPAALWWGCLALGAALAVGYLVLAGAVARRRGAPAG